MKNIDWKITEVMEGARLREAGYSWQRIADMLGKPRETTRKMVVKYGKPDVPKNMQPHKGQNGVFSYRDHNVIKFPWRQPKEKQRAK